VNPVIILLDYHNSFFVHTAQRAVFYTIVEFGFFFLLLLLLLSGLQDLLMDVRDKLLFEPEYAGNMREKIPPKSPLRIPWAWLPAALCLLQEVQTFVYILLSL
jgi:hypothetical protein